MKTIFSQRYTNGMVLTLLLALWFASPINVSAQKKTKSTTEVCKRPTVMPEFPGGTEALIQYLSREVRYPKEAMEAGISGRVYVSFVVTKSGKLTNIRVVKPAHPLLNAEAIRVVKFMPKWKPGMENGQPINTEYTMPIVFRLQ